MADPTSSSSLPSRPKSRRWLRWLGLSGLILVLLLVTVYFVATSGAFFKGFILPRVAQALHARVTVADAVIHPFSGVSLTDLKVETTGTEPLLSAREVRARYSLWDILRGQLNIAEVLVSQPTVVIVKNADGTSNLDPLTQGEGRGEAGKKSRKPDPSPGAGGAKAGRPPQIDLRSFRLENATVRTVTQMPGGGQTLAEVSKVTITLENLKNGQTGKFTLGSDFSYQLQPVAPQPAASVQGHVAAAFEVALGADLSLTSLRGNLQLGLPAATGSLAEAAGFTLGLDTELGADPASQTATLRAFSLKGARRETPLLLGTLTSPLRVSWGGGGGADTSDAAMSVVLTNVNLAEWKGFAPALDASGRAQGTLLVTSKKSGQQIGFNLAAAVENLAARVGSNAVNSLQILVTAQGEANNGQQIELTAARFSVAQGTDPAAVLTAKASLDLARKLTRADAHLEADFPRLLRILPQPGMTLTSGTAQMDTHVNQQGGQNNVAGTLSVRSLTGNLNGRALTDLGLGLAYDLGVRDGQQLELRRAQVTLVPTARAKTNAVDLTGTLDLSQPNALAGALKLAADTLDVTPYYDLFADAPAGAAGPKPGSAPSASMPAPGSPGGPEQEPAPIRLPVRALTFEMAVGHCYLRELDVAHLAALASLTPDQVTLRPFKFSLNGGPVSADLDANLSVPGFRYAVAFSADRLPVEPIANSFSPAYRGQAKGELLGTLNLKGEGITGLSIQKNLAGALGLTLTNANIQLAGPRAKALLTPIALMLGAPDLLSSPLNWLGADAKVGAGKLNLNQFSVVSPAFMAGAAGEIPLAVRLQDSPIRHWPVNFSLRRALARKLNFADKGDATGANSDYVLLPNMITASGTLGAPETKVDKTGMLQLGVRAVTALPGSVGKEASKIVGQADQLLGGRLTGTPKASTTTTNAAGETNAAPAANLLDLFKNKKKAK